MRNSVSDQKDMRAAPAATSPSGQRDNPAAGELYERHADALYSLARLLCQDSPGAEEAFVTILADAGPTLVNMTPEAQRRCLAADLWHRHRRRTAATSAVPDRLPAPRAPRDGSAWQRGQEQALLGLVMFGSHTYTQAADLVGVPAQTAASHLRTGLRRGANTAGRRRS